ncbi:MAG: glyoxalase superfamily protein [Henriciella sp.]|uniref:glyoxalase superfamily protein n=1 Tax=Henriciella sp. TaxID=1968823 RepID=UPI003C746101
MPDSPTPKPARTREQAKARARQLRSELAAAGQSISHAKALEKVAHELGYRDWNTASARLSNQPEVPLQVGDRVSGHYLKQPFEGRVHAVRELAGGIGYEVTLHFDTPVDVVEFESFSGLRQRVSAMISEDGVSWNKTSDGVPHLVVQPEDALIV